MRFLTVVKSDESMPVGPPPPELMAGIAELGVRATMDGTLLDQGGLMPTATGAVVRVAGGKVTVVDGPFTEAKEVIGGYAMWQVRSKEEPSRPPAASWSCTPTSGPITRCARSWTPRTSDRRSSRAWRTPH